MKAIENITRNINKSTSTKLTQCIGAHNEVDWIEYTVKGTYDEFDRIIIVEGAVEGRPGADARGHSTDGTVDKILELDDPQEKIELLQIERPWKTLEEQKQQFLNMSNDGDILVITDADEVWHPRDIKRLRRAFEMYGDACSEIIPIFLHFWGDTNIVKRYQPAWNVCHQRAIRYREGMQYRSHPIATDRNGVDTCLSPQYQQFRYTVPDMYVYHYGYCKDLEFQKQKMEFYESELKKHNNAHIEHRQKYEEHQNGTFDPKSLLHFTGEHPEVMRDHPIMQYKYPHVDDYNAFDDYKTDSIYKDGARVPLIPNWMLPHGDQPAQWPEMYRELRFLEE